MNYEDQAKNYFCNHFNCAQAVLTTFATELGLDQETALKIATLFGGARKGEICGAVSGALMVLGLKYGHCHAEDLEEKAREYQIAEDFMDRFITEKGTVVCRELLGYDLSKKEDRTKIVQLGLFKTTCPEMIRCAVTITEQMMNEVN